MWAPGFQSFFWNEDRARLRGVIARNYQAVALDSVLLKPTGVGFPVQFSGVIPGRYDSIETPWHAIKPKVMKQGVVPLISPTRVMTVGQKAAAKNKEGQ